MTNYTGRNYHIHSKNRRYIDLDPDVKAAFITEVKRHEEFLDELAKKQAKLSLGTKIKHIPGDSPYSEGDYKERIKDGTITHVYFVNDAFDLYLEYGVRYAAGGREYIRSVDEHTLLQEIKLIERG